MNPAEGDVASATDGQEEAPTSGWRGYLHELQIVFVITMAVVCAVAIVIGWRLHPASNGFPAIPQGLSLVTSGSQFTLKQTLTPTEDGGATLQVDEPQTLGHAPGQPLLNNVLYDPTDPRGPTVAPVPIAIFDGRPIPNRSWTYLVLNPGTAQPCHTAPPPGEDVTSSYKSGKVFVPWVGKTVPAFVVKVSYPQAVDNGFQQRVICLHWSSGSPVATNGAYLSARFPPVHGIAVDYGVAQYEPDTGGDVATGTVTRVLNLADSLTYDFNVQSQPQATVSENRSWTWRYHDLAQTVQLAAINSSVEQQETNNALYAGIAFGIAGGALVALIAELVGPFSRRKATG